LAAPPTGEILTQWTWSPSVLLGIAVLTAAYVYTVGPLRERRNLGLPATRTRLVAFVAAQFTLVLALLSPLDYIGDRYLFSAHMIQHLLLATLWPPLMLVALPPWLGRRLVTLPVIGPLAALLTSPFLATVGFNLDIYIWHIPFMYDATLSKEYVHIVEHLTFMLTGLFVWWCILAPNMEDRLSYPFQTLYLFLNAMFMMVLGIIFTFAPDPFYAPYTRAPRLWGISAGTDQQIGGLIMWYPGNLPYAALLVVRFYQWFDGADPGRMEQQAQSHTIERPSPETGL
jgi:cytochrome c oxidase assembly factor CtaG